MIVCKSLYFYPSSELCHCLLRRMYTLNSTKQPNKKFPVNYKNSPRNQRKAICRENLSLEYNFVGVGQGEERSISIFGSLVKYIIVLWLSNQAQRLRGWSY